MSEREIYLMKNDNDKGNGFYNRKLATPVGNLETSQELVQVSLDLIFSLNL